jgi:hypothetical protein
MDIERVCSLGTRCQTANILRRNNLKLCSYPFDWIFSNPENVIDCIQDDFDKFLDKSYYINICETKCGHAHYYNHMFFHRNPLSNAADYDYYVRCVDRFRILLKSQEHKLFIILFVNGEYDSLGPQFKNNIIKFNDIFSKYTTNYTLLIIIHHPHKECNYHTVTKTNNIHFLELHTPSDSSGGDFKDAESNIYLDNVLKTTYKFKFTTCTVNYQS